MMNKESEEADEEEEDEEDGESDDFIDILDILDGRGEADSEDDSRKAEQQRAKGSKIGSGDGFEQEIGGDGSADEDEYNEDTENASDIALSVSDDEVGADRSALQTLETFITNLDPGRKRRDPDGEGSSWTHSADQRSRKRRILKELELLIRQDASYIILSSFRVEYSNS